MLTPPFETGGTLITLENFIIDTFTRIDEVSGEEVSVDQEDQIGGGGTYAIIGARIFLPPSELGMIIDYTPSTFPLAMKARLMDYGVEAGSDSHQGGMVDESEGREGGGQKDERGIWVFKERYDGHPTLRAVNRYKGQLRLFEYLTQPIHNTPLSLLNTRLTSPLPTMIHFISFPDLGVQVIKEIPELADKAGVKGWRPGIIWEPEPPACSPEYFEGVKQVTKGVDIISPNHTEAFTLFSLPAPNTGDDDTSRKEITKVCRLVHSLQPRYATVIRAGHLGSCYALTSSSSSSVHSDGGLLVNEKEDIEAEVEPEVEVRWVAAYWSAEIEGYEGKVVDPTGAGNAFMGGLSAALNSGLDMPEAMIWGTVSASFTIEQDGLPYLTRKDGRELWNGEDPVHRVESMKKRMGISSM